MTFFLISPACAPPFDVDARAATGRTRTRAETRNFLDDACEFIAASELRFRHGVEAALSYYQGFWPADIEAHCASFTPL